LKKRISFVALLATLGLIMIVLVPGCSQPGATSTPPSSSAPVVTTTAPGTTVTNTVDKTYKVINPNGTFIPIETKPLAARLDTIDNKTIYFTESEANPRIMPALLKKMKETYTKTNFVYTATASFGDSVPSDDMLKNAQGYIRGISW